MSTGRSSVKNQLARLQKSRISHEPRGMHVTTLPTTPAPDDETDTRGMPRGLKIFLAIIGLIVVAFIVLHPAGGGLGHHGM